MISPQIAKYWRKMKTRIYNLSSGPHIIRFTGFAAKKRKNFE